MTEQRFTEDYSYNFAFLSIDIVRHSTWSLPPKSYASESISKTKQALRIFVNRKASEYGGTEWNWLGDGGLWFYGGEGMCENAVLTAMELLGGMAAFNVAMSEIPEKVLVRLCCHRGETQWKSDRTSAHSPAINYIGHLIGVPQAGEIIISESCYSELPAKFQQNFDEAGEFEGGKIYVFGKPELQMRQLTKPPSSSEIPATGDEVTEAMIRAAVKSREAGSYLDAQLLLELSIRQSPVGELRESAYLELGRTLYLDRQYERLNEKMSEAIDLFPDNASLYSLKGLALTRMGKDEARSLLETAKEKEPQAAKHVNNLAVYEWRRGAIETAIKLSRQALDLEPKNAAARNNLAYFLAEDSLLQDLQEAHRLAYDVYREQPTNPSRVGTLAFVLFKKGDLEQAEKEVRRWLELDLEDTQALLLLAHVLAAKGRKPEAEALLEKVINREKYNNWITRQARGLLTKLKVEQNS